jgi:hypothetical protein
VKHKIKPFLLVSLLTLVSCVGMVPDSVIGQLKKDFEGAPDYCIGMFMNRGLECKDNPSWCVDYNLARNVQSYQDAAQTMLASFAVARKEDNTIALCTWNRQGTFRGYDSLDKLLLSSCERVRLTYMSKNQISLKKCEIYAHGNDIL